MVRLTRIILAAGLAMTAQWGCSPINESGGRDFQVNGPAELVVKATRVVRQNWVVTVPASGSLRSLSTVEIKSEVGGRLMATHFQEGDFVRQGQILAEIDPVNYRLAYDQAVAALSVAEAGLERAQITADHANTEKQRADNLLRTGGITEKDHQAAVTGVKEAASQVRLAEAQCEQARATVAIAEKALKDCKVFSPAQGHVQKRFFDKGSLLVPGSSLYSLVDNSQLELECLIPSYRLAEIRVGQRGAFTTPTWGERVFRGTVSAINPVVESDNRSVKLKLKIANPGGELRSGMYARGKITVGDKPRALIIPRDSLIPEREGSEAAGVYVIREGKAHRLDVVIGDIQQDLVRVEQGLQQGEWVITEIGPALKDGTAVRVSGDFGDPVGQ